MTDVGKKIIEGLNEALSIAKGDQPAARVTINGHTYVPEAEYATLRRERDEAREQVKKLQALQWYPYEPALWISQKTLDDVAGLVIAVGVKTVAFKAERPGLVPLYRAPASPSPGLSKAEAFIAANPIDSSPGIAPEPSETARKLAHEILGAHCACYAEAWPAATCAEERDAVALMLPAPAAPGLREALQWPEPSPPTKDVSAYDHIKAHGFTIEWKSWKSHPAYTVIKDAVDEQFIGTFNTLDEAKAAAIRALATKGGDHE